MRRRWKYSESRRRLTYPLQFASGALINTAGSGNDFVGGTNGYGNVEFNGLPALSNGYIVDGYGNERSTDQSEQRTLDQIWCWA